MLQKNESFCDKPVVTWKGEDEDGEDCVRIGQVDAETGKPFKGGFYRHEIDGIIYELFSTNGARDRGFERYFESTYCLTSPIRLNDF